MLLCVTWQVDLCYGVLVGYIFFKFRPVIFVVVQIKSNNMVAGSLLLLAANRCRTSWCSWSCSCWSRPNHGAASRLTKTCYRCNLSWPRWWPLRRRRRGPHSSLVSVLRTFPQDVVLEPFLSGNARSRSHLQAAIKALAYLNIFLAPHF